MDGRPATLGYEEGTGYVRVGVGDGTHRVALRYGGSAAESIGIVLAALTTLALAVAGVIAVWRRRTASASAPNLNETTLIRRHPLG